MKGIDEVIELTEDQMEIGDLKREKLRIAHESMANDKKNSELLSMRTPTSRAPVLYNSCSSSESVSAVDVHIDRNTTPTTAIVRNFISNF